MTSVEVVSAEQRVRINELKSRMEGHLDDKSREDESLYRRFLRARNYNVDAAEEMLRKCLAWRKLNKMDTILTDYTVPEVLEKYIPLTQFGFDRDGAPVMYFDFGNCDIRGLLKAHKASEIIRHFTWLFENYISSMKEQSAKLGKPVEQFIYIIDLENFSLKVATHRPTLENLAILASVFDANFPERLKSAFIVNAAFYFTLFWTILSPLIPEETSKKVKVFGKDHWKGELLKGINADVVPAFLGGNRTDPDGNSECKTFIKFGEVVPKQYYVIKSESDFSRKPGTKKLVVSRRSKEEVRLQVELPDSKMEYEFEVKNKDIAFSVLYEKNGSKIEGTDEIIPKQRIQNDTLESGVFACDRLGVYIIQFDNSYSWIYQKEIYYTARIVSPTNQKP